MTVELVDALVMFRRAFEELFDAPVKLVEHLHALVEACVERFRVLADFQFFPS